MLLLQIEADAPHTEGVAAQNSCSNSRPLREWSVTSYRDILFFPCFHLNPAWYMCRCNLNRMFSVQYAIVTLYARFVSSIMWAHCEHVLLQKRGWFYGAFGSFKLYLDYLSKPSIFLLIYGQLIIAVA